MKILIENTVPFNNGDAALIFSVGDKYEERGYEVYYSTVQFDLAKKVYPEKKWLESPLSSRIVNIPLIGYLFLLLYLMTNKELKKFKAVISAPGGYINSYYSIKRKLQLMYLYKKVNHQNIYLYSQSIGPLNNKDEILLQKYLPHFNLVYARDEISKSRLDRLNIVENTFQTKDAAFLLNPLSKINAVNKTVAISVREWGFDNRSEEQYIKLIEKITIYFYKNDYSIVFLSTCQGIETYRDDSKMAKKIYESLPLEIKEKTSVDSEYYKLYELRNKLKEFKFVIGTRLHMCILSWLSGTPAFNISYEEKGLETYKYLGLEELSVDYNYSGNIEKKLDLFLNSDYQEIFKNIIDINEESINNFNRIYNDILVDEKNNLS